MENIPTGYCQCGCGQKTQIAKYDNPWRNQRAGHPRRFLPHHHKRLSPVIKEQFANRTGICACGCGLPTSIAKKSNVKTGIVAGLPMRYIYGHRSKKTLTERFWSKVNKGSPEDCWEWTGARLPWGYGRMQKNGHLVGSHCVAYELAYGSVPKGYFVLHKCDNPPCCNPSHLFLGTNQDNMNDMISKGRGWWQSH